MNQQLTCSRRRWTAGLSVLGLCAAIAAVSAVGFYGHELSFARGSEPPPPAVAQANDLSAAFRYAANQVLPSVVTIRTTMGEIQQTGGQVPEGFPEELQPFLKRFFGDDFQGVPRRMPQQQGMGSGVIIDPSGIILTNNHVVGGGSKVVVRLHDGREFEATAVKTDPKTDVAVVRISGAGDLPAARIGNSDDMQIGDWVLAVGAPFGLQETVTAGIISAKSRGLGIAEREEFLQTDAAINPGNSGGPLVNLRGEVVGVNTAISTSGGGNDGVGFAVPVNLAQWVSRQLIENGTVQRAFLGVGIQQVTSDLSHQFGLSVVQGAVVTEVRPDTAAANAGLQTGDVIVDFDGHAVASPRELQNLVERAALDTEHHVTVVRDGKRLTIDVTLQAMPQSLAAADQAAASAPKSEFEHLGLQVSELSDDVARQLNITGVRGVVITGVEPDSLAALAGLQEGMVITRVGQQKVASVDEFRAAMKDASLKDGLLMLVQTSDGSRFIVLKQ
jgi:serine protease Do